jgi:hypothetical protein
VTSHAARIEQGEQKAGGFLGTDSQGGQDQQAETSSGRENLKSPGHRCGRRFAPR